MAVLHQTCSGNHVLLNALHTIGRLRSTSQLCISENDISRLHATIGWRDGSWHLRDQSRNGTLVNGKHILHDTVNLSAGDVIKFGKGASAQWTLLDASPPCSYLQSLVDETQVLALTSCPGIPNPEGMEASFYYADFQWKMESGDTCRNLIHGTVVELGTECWKFVENEAMDVTVNYVSAYDKAVFCFSLSPDEERIALKILMNELELDLGERVYHYLLLSLARKRLEDSQQGYLGADQGWMPVDALVHDMSKEVQKEVDAYYLNVQIYRLRKQLLETEPHGYMFSNVIERRKGEIRFAAPHFRILKENQIIGEIRHRESA